MQNHRIFVDKSCINRKRYVVKDMSLAHYLRSVLRLRKGSEVTLFDGQGMEYEASIGFLSKDTISGVITEEKVMQLKDKPYLILAQSLPRAGKLDEIIRMNTEIGVREFVLFESEYGLVPAKNIKPAKIIHLQKVAQEAERQSGNPYLPEIVGPVSFKKMVEAEVDAIKVILHHKEIKGVVNFNKVKSGLKKGAKVILAVGPEGGFSTKEIDHARENGWTIAYLDLPVLRTETAGIAASAIILA